MKIYIKPLSVNEAWQGRRFKSPKYKVFENFVLLSLKASKWKPSKQILSGPVEVEFWFGLSSKNADIDNPVKPMLDIIQKHTGFNDKQVHRLIVNRVQVAKGDEYVRFEVRKFNLQD